MTYAGEQDLKCSGEQQFCISCYAFEIKEEKQGRLQEAGKKRDGTGLPGGSNYVLSCVLQEEGSEGACVIEGVLSWKHRNNGQDLLKAQAWDTLPTMTQ